MALIAAAGTSATTFSRPVLRSQEKWGFRFRSCFGIGGGLSLRNGATSLAAVASSRVGRRAPVLKKKGQDEEDESDEFDEDDFEDDEEEEEDDLLSDSETESESDTESDYDSEEAVSATDSEDLAIANLGVAQEIVDSLADRGITQLFPIQRAVFVPAMKGLDLIGRAKTGTGKTLAFAIPILDRIYKDRSKRRRMFKGPVALVLAPTRELAKQVEKEFMETAKDLATVCVYGGVPIASQKRLLSKGVDIAVGTPGRIIDLVEQGALDLSNVEVLVLDEADQMLAVGFEEDVETIMQKLPSERQNMLFSATMPSWVRQLSKKFLNKPLTIDLVGESDEKLAAGIELFAVQVSRNAKRKVLSDIITVYGKGGKTIVFTKTKVDAEEVAGTMSRTLGCEALHGDIAQFQREKSLAGFREGKFLILVATDVAARGLDITNVDLVIHYDLPQDSETFVHRSGRTGRAGKEGIALAIYSPEQKRVLKRIEKDVGCSFQYKKIPPYDEVMKASTGQAVKLIEGVHPELKEAFTTTAETLLKEHGTGAFAAAIAFMTGFSQPPAARSLITFEPGYMTLKFSRIQRSALTPRNVLGAIASISEKAADNIREVQMMDDDDAEDGGVFDLPEDIAKDLLTKELPSGTRIEALKELPNLAVPEGDDEDEEFGWGRGRRGRGSGRGNRYGRSEGGYGRSSESRGYGRGSGSRIDDYYSGRSSGNFGGSCYKCGRPGHRASECNERGGRDERQRRRY